MLVRNIDKLQKYLHDAKVDKIQQEELLSNLHLSLDSIEKCWNSQSDVKKPYNVNLSWVDTFSCLWESKLSRNEVQNKVDLIRLVLIFRICASQVLVLLKGQCINSSNLPSFQKRQFYLQLSCLEAPLVDFIRRFVATASKLNCVTSGFLEVISDLTSIQLEHKVLCLRLNETKSSPVSKRLFAEMEDLYQITFPDSIELRLDTCLKCSSLNNIVAVQVYPFLRDTLDKCRRMQRKLEHITLATYVKFVLLYARWYKLCGQGRLDSTIVLDQSRSLPSPVFPPHSRDVEDCLHSLLSSSYTKSNTSCNVPCTEMMEKFIIRMDSVSKTYKNLQNLSLDISHKEISTEIMVRTDRTPGA